MSNPTELPSTTCAAREYLVAWHLENFDAPYFTDYINTVLAGDFVYNLSRWLARRAQPEGEAPQAERADERKDFEAAMIARGYQHEMFDGFYAEGEHAYYDKMANCMFSAWRAALAAQSQGAPDGFAERVTRYGATVASQQAAAPGALDADEMTRLRRLMRALGLLDEKRHTDEHVRGMLCTVLGWAAGQIEGKPAPSAPGTPEAPSRDDVLEEAASACESEFCSCCWSDDEVAAGAHMADVIRGMKSGAAQFDGGQGEGEKA